MAEVVTFVGYRPPVRYDGIPWTRVRIQEAAAVDGSYTQLEEILFSPVDTDPSQPQTRSFTTELGTAIDYWYRVVFAEQSPFGIVALGGEAPPSYTGRNSWRRHANALLPLKTSFGLG
jgi:hypothetical protein